MDGSEGLEVGAGGGVTGEETGLGGVGGTGGKDRAGGVGTGAGGILRSPIGRLGGRGVDVCPAGGVLMGGLKGLREEAGEDEGSVDPESGGFISSAIRYRF